MSSTTLNYAVVAVGIVLVYSLGFWVISARKWFRGPVKQILGEPARAQETIVLTFAPFIAAEEMGIEVTEQDRFETLESEGKLDSKSNPVESIDARPSNSSSKSN